MIPVSSKFKQAVYAPIRTCKARVRFEILDTEAFKDNAKQVTSEASIGRSNQLTNKIRSATNKYAVFEKDYFKLDGSFLLPPKTNELIDHEVGWWSGALSDGNCLFSPSQVLTFTFSKEHSSMGLTIYFDMLNNEYAMDFDIDVYNSSGAVIKHDSIANNTSSRYIYINQLSNYTKITISIKKWCKPYRRAKIVEFDFGIIKEYEDNNLIKMNILQELDLTSSTLPSDEVKFTVDNSSKEFNVLNPKGFYEFLQDGQEVFVDFGLMLENGDYEYIPCGKYYLKNWQSDEGTITSTFTARDVLDKLSNTEIENRTAKDMTLYDFVVNILNDSGIDKYVLSDNLKSIRTKALHNKMSYRNLLQMVAVAGMCVVYTDNQGVFHMKQLISVKSVIDSVNASNSAIVSNVPQVINNILEPTYNMASFEKDRFKLDGSFHVPSRDISSYEMGWWSGALSDSTGAFENPLMITILISKDHASVNLRILFDVLNNEYASNFTIKAYDSAGNIKVNETISNNSSDYIYQNALLENSRKIEIVINKWCNPYRRARVVEIGFDLPLDNLTFDNIYKEPQIETSQSVKSVEVTYFTDLDTKCTYIATSNEVRDGIVLKVENTLIDTQSDAKNVAEWILKENNQSATFNVDWRQNPALCLGDKVSVENGYGTNHFTIISKQEYTYEGYLRGKTKAKGAI